MKRTIQYVFAGVFVLWFSGCGTPHPPRDLNVKSIMKPESFPAEQRAAIQASALQLTLDGESPSDFYAEVRTETNNVLVVELWHESAFKPKNRLVVGNPGGKCRNFYYDTNWKKITDKLFWQ